MEIRIYNQKRPQTTADLYNAGVGVESRMSFISNLHGFDEFYPLREEFRTSLIAHKTLYIAYFKSVLIVEIYVKLFNSCEFVNSCEFELKM